MSIQKPFRTKQINQPALWRMSSEALYRHLSVILKDYHWTDDQGWVWTVETPSKEIHLVPEIDLLIRNLN